MESPGKKRGIDDKSTRVFIKISLAYKQENSKEQNGSNMGIPRIFNLSD